MRLFPFLLLLLLLSSCDGNIRRIETIGDKLRELPKSEVYDSAFCARELPEVSGITAEIYESLFLLPGNDAEMSVEKITPAIENYLSDYELVLSGGRETTAGCVMQIFLKKEGETFHITHASQCHGCG